MVIVSIIILCFAAFFFYKIKAFENLSAEYRNKGEAVEQIGDMAGKEYFTRKGWIYRITGYILVAAAFLLFIFSTERIYLEEAVVLIVVAICVAYLAVFRR